MMRARILVVDDEPDLEHLIRQKFRKKIRNNEVRFDFAENGMDALDKLDEIGDVDVVLTDINMPEMDGLTLLTKLKERESLLLKPVIVSAYGDMDNIRTAMNRGAFDFVTKPIDLQDLEATIDKSLAEVRLLKTMLKAHDKLVAIQRELRIATEIQTSILPQTFPDRRELDIFARMITAKEVGGDFYDFFPIDKHRIGLAVGDVTGKGVPAAMLMAVSRTLLKATALKGIPPDACLSEVNNVIAEDSSPTMFVTLFYGVLDIRNGTLEYCNGGHNPPYIVSADGRLEKLDFVGGVFVGSVKDVEYESRVTSMRPGDALVVYTDGITEAFNEDEEDFHEARLEDCLKKTSGHTAEELTCRVLEEVEAFSDGAPQSDDITILTLKYHGA